MLTKIFILLLLIALTSSTGPIDDKVNFLVPQYGHDWYSGSLSLIKDISTLIKENSIMFSSTPRKTQTTIPSSFG
jgi:hypothetical protein